MNEEKERKDTLSVEIHRCVIYTKICLIDAILYSFLWRHPRDSHTISKFQLSWQPMPKKKVNRGVHLSKLLGWCLLSLVSEYAVASWAGDGSVRPILFKIINGWCFFGEQEKEPSTFSG
jgi:uncharacterized membrane protein